jgi:hypothetical protein
VLLWAEGTTLVNDSSSKMQKTHGIQGKMETSAEESVLAPRNMGRHFLSINSYVPMFIRMSIIPVSMLTACATESYNAEPFQVLKYISSLSLYVAIIVVVVAELCVIHVLHSNVSCQILVVFLFVFVRIVIKPCLNRGEAKVVMLIYLRLC